jgi:predicted dinucleotide-binding enzyme
VGHITMIGGGALIRPLAVLSTRAGHSILRIDDGGIDSASCSYSDMIIVAGDRTALVDLSRRVASVARPDAVVIDATTRVEDGRAEGADELMSEERWVSLFPSLPVVRAFASVPVEAFMVIVDQTSTHRSFELAVPMAGDDVNAKERVAEFMRQVGVKPFDLGPLTVSYVMDPGGSLWDKALDLAELLECVGWLSGDG